MFFEKESVSFHLLDVLELKQGICTMRNTGRNFSALSYRFRADTHLRTDSDDYHMTDHSVAYVPARLDYTRSTLRDELIVVHFEATDYRGDGIEIFLPKEPQVLGELFRQILDCWNQKAPGYRHRCSALLYQILAECYVQHGQPPAAVSKIGASVEYMLANYKRHELSIGEIARQSFMSEVYFRRLFKEEYGLSPQKYLIRLRIRNAVGLIATGYYSLGEVARLSGYEDYKYFSVEFKRLMGVSPSQYSYNFYGNS